MAGYYTEMDMDTAERLTCLQRAAAVCIVKAMSKVDLYTLVYVCNPHRGLEKEFTATDMGPYSDTIDEGLALLRDIGYIRLNPVRPMYGYNGLVNAIVDYDPTYRTVRAEAEKLCKGDVRTYTAHVIEEIEMREGKA